MDPKLKKIIIISSKEKLQVAKIEEELFLVDGRYMRGLSFLFLNVGALHSGSGL